MKGLGIAILALGVGICAAFGARQTPEMFEYTVIGGRAMFLGGAETAAKDAYCEARAQAKLAVADGCPDPEAKHHTADKDEAAPAEPKAEPTLESLVARRRAELATLRDGSEARQATTELAALRTAWLDAKEAAIEPTAQAELAKPQAPGERLSGWMSQSGGWFLLGLLLVVAGAVVGRVAVRKEIEAAGAPGDAGVLDPSQILGSLLEEIRALHQDMLGKATPTSDDFDRFKDAIDVLLIDKVQPLVEARASLQHRWGLAGFAAVFSPFSAGERRLNRAWSALVDSHWPEACASAERAVQDLQTANAELADLGKAA